MANLPERAGVVRDETTGELILPATQRPDGTWRKPRRVKDGYIPQDEVPAYETKGTQWAKSRPDHPIGLNPDDVEKMRQRKSEEQVETQNPPGLSKSAKKNAKRKEKRKQQQADSSTASNMIDSAAAAMSSVKISSEKPNASGDAKLTQEEISKKVKGLRKKLRQIEDLEAKINSGELKNPEKDQLEKVQRKHHIIDEIEDLELDLEDD